MNILLTQAKIKLYRLNQPIMISDDNTENKIGMEYPLLKGTIIGLYPVEVYGENGIEIKSATLPTLKYSSLVHKSVLKLKVFESIQGSQKNYLLHMPVKQVCNLLEEDTAIKQVLNQFAKEYDDIIISDSKIHRIFKSGNLSGNRSTFMVWFVVLLIVVLPLLSVLGLGLLTLPLFVAFFILVFKAKDYEENSIKAHAPEINRLEAEYADRFQQLILVKNPDIE